MPNRGYKGKSAGERSVRRKILELLLAKFPTLDCAADCASSSDLLDSLIASLTTGLAARRRTLQPGPADAALARREGWIHLPSE